MKINILEIIIIALSLSMDALGVSICKGINNKKINIKKSIIVGLYFGISQGIMPIIGYFLGNIFNNKMVIFNKVIAFLLLAFIGISMIIDTKNEKDENASIKFREMGPLSIITSLDALIVGVSLAFLNTDIIASSLIIAIITFINTAIGYIFGNIIGYKYQKKSQIIGGIALIILGLKFLIEVLF